MDETPGYKMGKKLRDGDNYTIFCARRISDDKKVVIKAPREGYRNERSFSRLSNEFEIGGKFNHTYIIKYIELINGGDGPLLVSEFFEAKRFFAPLETLSNLALQQLLQTSNH